MPSIDKVALEKAEENVFRLPLELFHRSHKGRLGGFPATDLDPNAEVPIDTNRKSNDK